jgi:hypothetical protein
VWPFTQWLWGVISRRSASRSAQTAQMRERLLPQKKLTLSEAEEIEPVALAAVNELLTLMNNRRRQFVSERMDKWGYEYKSVAARARDADHQKRLLYAEVDKHGGEMHRYAKQLGDDVVRLGQAQRQLADAYSSRMYWHDERGTASDILGSRVTLIRELLETIARVTDQFAESPEVTDKALGGRRPKMDEGLRRYRESMDALHKVNVEFEWMYESVIDFKRRRSGVRGFWRRLMP